MSDTIEEDEDATDARSADDEDDDVASHLFGAKCPKAEFVFLCQVIDLYTVIVLSIYNWTSGHADSSLWTAMLTRSLGYLQLNRCVKRDDS